MNPLILFIFTPNNINSLGIKEQHVNLAQRLKLDFMFLICHDIKQVFCYVSNDNKELHATLISKNFLKQISNLYHDVKTGDITFTINKLNQILINEIYSNILESNQFNQVIIASLQTYKIEVISRGQELYIEDLQILFDTDNKLCFYDRDEISKNYKLYCPFTNHDVEKTDVRNQSNSLKLFQNLPLSVLILGQTTKPKFKQRG